MMVLPEIHPEFSVQPGEVCPFNLEQAAVLLPDAASALLEYVLTDDQTRTTITAPNILHQIIRIELFPK